MRKIWKDIILISFAICLLFNIIFEFLPFKKSIKSIENIFSIYYDSNVNVNVNVTDAFHKLQSYSTKWNDYGYNPDNSSNHNIKFYESMTSPSENFSRTVKGCFMVAGIKFKQNVLLRIFSIGEDRPYIIEHKIKDNIFIYSNLNGSSFQNTIVKSGYFIGIIGGSLFLPFVFWCLGKYFSIKEKLKNKTQYDIELASIRNSNEYSEEFDLKMESLQNMFNSKILSIKEFNLRKNEIIEYYKNLNKLDLEKEKKKKQLKVLDEALKNKTISEEEYLKKIDWFDLK